ncbi:hypothetical protein [Micromonospora sp. NPDC049374]|uniref:hypothetical protein n=1 Tax=Micromonospora sp. NPDC049374 TaxID=3154352 RepID=UPI0034362F91
MRARPATLLAALLLVTGCAAGTPPTAGPSSPLYTGPSPALAPAADPPPAGGPPTVALPGTTRQFSATDIAWLQLTAAMAERLLPMLDLVPNRTNDRGWRRLATAEQQGGAHPATTALAAAVVRTGTAHLARLDHLDRPPTLPPVPGPPQ